MQEKKDTGNKNRKANTRTNAAENCDIKTQNLMEGEIIN